MNRISYRHFVSLLAFAAHALSKGDRPAWLKATQAAGGYRSRGKGRGTISPRYVNLRSVYTPHQGRQERMRRLLVGGFQGYKHDLVAELNPVQRKAA